ncbi:hAT transposon superfamily protein [Striga hermonthica]|uniref:HAT transposon superfamily protein n=1 Tax=Striga hermonthica TaxID=68872 RepID=A0A9N7QZD6_STRHE|nr:hAT transposon superfamily protein [Striga hermonthica]
MEPPSSGQPAAVEKENVLKRKSDDVGWDYGFLVDPTNMNKVKCKLCGHESSGGIYRLKQHIAHVGTTVAKCKDSKPEDKEKCKKSLDGAARKKREKIVRELSLREDVNVSRVEGGTEEEVTCIGSSEPHKLGPIDKWTRPIDPKSTQAEALKQQKLNKELWKQRTHEVQRYVARWMYAHGIPFNSIDNDEFLQMCEAIGQFGVGFEPPSQDQLRGGLLAEEYARTKSLLLERDAEKIKNGCSVLTDAWSDKKRRSIMNLCTNCADGTSFREMRRRCTDRKAEAACGGGEAGVFRVTEADSSNDDGEVGHGLTGTDGWLNEISWDCIVRLWVWGAAVHGKIDRSKIDRSGDTKTEQSSSTASSHGQSSLPVALLKPRLLHHSSTAMQPFAAKTIRIEEIDIIELWHGQNFGGNETEANTRRVVGTYDYMSPEYAVDGMFSLKSDVYSFDVLVLKIVSSQKNRGFHHKDHHHNLVGHVSFNEASGEIRCLARGSNYGFLNLFGLGFPVAESAEEPPCSLCLRKYETMAMLRPDMSEDELLAFSRSRSDGQWQFTMLNHQVSKLIPTVYLARDQFLDRRQYVLRPIDDYAGVAECFNLQGVSVRG